MWPQFTISILVGPIARYSLQSMAPVLAVPSLGSYSVLHGCMIMMRTVQVGACTVYKPIIILSCRLNDIVVYRQVRLLPGSIIIIIILLLCIYILVSVHAAASGDHCVVNHVQCTWANSCMD